MKEIRNLRCIASFLWIRLMFSLLRYSYDTRNNCHKFYLWFHTSVSSLAKTQRVNLFAHIILSIFPKEATQSAITVDQTISHFINSRLGEVYISCFFFGSSDYFSSTLYHRNSVILQKWQVRIRTDYPWQRTVMLFDQQYVSLESSDNLTRCVRQQITRELTRTFVVDGLWMTIGHRGWLLTTLAMPVAVCLSGPCQSSSRVVS